jgi:hypothetical protein
MATDHRSVLRAPCRRGAGLSAAVPLARARHGPASGHPPQAGCAGVHTVAPSSISASLVAPGARAAPASRAACSHAQRSVAASPIVAGASASRESTRTTLPSTIGVRSAKTMLAIAAAV